jgi:hypothetical protein
MTITTLPVIGHGTLTLISGHGPATQLVEIPVIGSGFKVNSTLITIYRIFKFKLAI